MLTIDQRKSILRSERIAGGILPKVLSSFDMLAIFVAIVLWIPNATTVTRAGAAAFIYWGLGFITCLIPGAIVTGQLGLMFPGEGSMVSSHGCKTQGHKGWSSFCLLPFLFFFQYYAFA